MNSRIIVTAVAFALVLVCGRGVLAHHGVSAYDVLNPVTIKGTVSEFVLQNPHSMLFLDVKDKDGKIVKWSIETGAPRGLRTPGGLKNMPKVGEEITVTLVAAKNGAPVGFSGANLGGGKIVRADGSVISSPGVGEELNAGPNPQ
jgi:hypothetical protein